MRTLYALSACLLAGNWVGAADPDKVSARDLTGKPQTLKHDDDSSDGKRSIAGQGHIVVFEAPKGEFAVTGVSLFGSRYGYPRPPKEDVAITLCDANLKALKTWKKPYSLFKRAAPEWHDVSLTPVRVSGKFALCLEFNPGRTKGVYVHLDTSSEGHSFIGRPGKTGRPLEGADWMIRVEVQPVKPGK